MVKLFKTILDTIDGKRKFKLPAHCGFCLAKSSFLQNLLKVFEVDLVCYDSHLRLRGRKFAIQST